MKTSKSKILSFLTLSAIGFLAVFFSASVAHAFNPGDVTPITQVLAGDGGEWVSKLYTLCKGILNIFLLIAIFVVAFSNILHINIETYQIKKMLPKIIAVALFANLSMPIFALLSKIVDSLQTLRIFEPTYVNFGYFFGAGAGVGSASSIVGFMALGTAAILLLIPATTIVGVCLGCALIFFPTVIILLLNLILAFRPWVVFLGAAVSPLAIACSIFPQTQNIFKKWLTLVVPWLFLPLLVFAVVNLTNYLPGSLGTSAGGAIATIIGFFLPFVLRAGLLIFAIRIPFSIEKDVSGLVNTVGKYAGKGVYKTPGWVGGWQKTPGIKTWAGKDISQGRNAFEENLIRGAKVIRRVSSRATRGFDVPIGGMLNRIPGGMFAGANIPNIRMPIAQISNISEFRKIASDRMRKRELEVAEESGGMGRVDPEGRVRFLITDNKGTYDRFPPDRINRSMGLAVGADGRLAEEDGGQWQKYRRMVEQGVASGEFNKEFFGKDGVLDRVGIQATNPDGTTRAYGDIDVSALPLDQQDAARAAGLEADIQAFQRRSVDPTDGTLGRLSPGERGDLFAAWQEEYFVKNTSESNRARAILGAKPSQFEGRDETEDFIHFLLKAEQKDRGQRSSFLREQSYIADWDETPETLAERRRNRGGGGAGGAGGGPGGGGAGGGGGAPVPGGGGPGGGGGGAPAPGAADPDDDEAEAEELEEDEEGGASGSPSARDEVELDDQDEDMRRLEEKAKKKEADVVKLDAGTIINLANEIAKSSDTKGGFAQLGSVFNKGIASMGRTLQESGMSGSETQNVMKRIKSGEIGSQGALSAVLPKQMAAEQERVMRTTFAKTQMAQALLMSKAVNSDTTQNSIKSAMMLAPHYDQINGKELSDTADKIYLHEGAVQNPQDEELQTFKLPEAELAKHKKVIASALNLPVDMVTGRIAQGASRAYETLGGMTPQERAAIGPNLPIPTSLVRVAMDQTIRDDSLIDAAKTARDTIVGSLTASKAPTAQEVVNVQGKISHLFEQQLKISRPDMASMMSEGDTQKVAVDITQQVMSTKANSASEITYQRMYDDIAGKINSKISALPKPAAPSNQPPPAQSGSASPTQQNYAAPSGSGTGPGSSGPSGSTNKTTQEPPTDRPKF